MWATAAGVAAAVVYFAPATAPPEPLEIGVLPGKEAELQSVAPIKGKACGPDDVDLVIFHAPCPDGFAAAFVAYLLRGDACRYIGISHNRKKVPDAIDGKNVAILDFSFDEKAMGA